jgi:hypothetical protein
MDKNLFKIAQIRFLKGIVTISMLPNVVSEIALEFSF